MNSFLRLWPQIEPLPAPRTGGGREKKRKDKGKHLPRSTDNERKGRQSKEKGWRKKKVGAAPPRYTCKESCDTHSSASALGMFLFSRLSFLPFLRGKNVFTQRGKGVSGQSDGEEHMMSQSEKKRIEQAAFCFFKALMEGEIEKYVSQFLPLSFSDRLCISPPEPFPRI